MEQAAQRSVGAVVTVVDMEHVAMDYQEQALVPAPVDIPVQLVRLRLGQETLISTMMGFQMQLKGRAQNFSLRARACNGKDYSANTRSANAFARQLTNTLNRAVGGKVYTCPAGVCTSYSTVSAKSQMRALAERLFRVSKRSKLNAEKACNHSRDENAKPDRRKRTIDYYEDLLAAIKSLPDSVTRCP